MERFSVATLARSIDGLNLKASSLGAQLASGPQPLTLVAFLRHYGCLFVREMVRDIRTATASGDYPNVLLVGQGDADETRQLLANTWPDAPAICDPDRVLYADMGLNRGTIYQMFGPAVWACSMRAIAKGSFIGRAAGDPWMMPGAFLVDQSGAVHWHHEFRHQGDHPDWAKIPEEAAALSRLVPIAKPAVL